MEIILNKEYFLMTFLPALGIIILGGLIGGIVINLALHYVSKLFKKRDNNE